MPEETPAVETKAQRGDGKINALTLADVAELLCLTKRQVTNLVEQGLPKHGQFHNSYYNWPEVFQWYLAFKVDNALKKQRDDRDAARRGSNGFSTDDLGEFEQAMGGDGENYNAASLRKLVAEADLAELKRAKERGEVVAIVDVEKSVAEVATNIRAKLLAMPGKLSPRLDAAKNKPQIKAILSKEVNQVLMELARPDDTKDKNTKVQKSKKAKAAEATK